MRKRIYNSKVGGYHWLTPVHFRCQWLVVAWAPSDIGGDFRSARICADQIVKDVAILNIVRLSGPDNDTE